MSAVIHEFKGRHAFLSNFYPSPVYIMIGMKWVKCPTVEHAYQASKTLDPDIRRYIVSHETPADAKYEGRKIRRVVYWDDVKTIVMLELLRQKFSRAALKRRLVGTLDAKLIEGNYWHDNFWGHCICDACRERPDGALSAPGLNMLGHLLMRVRKDVR